jgi:hypothetical protein
MSNPAHKDVPPEVQTIFDAINSYLDASQWTAVNTSATYDGSGIVNTISCNDSNNPNNFYNFTVKTVGISITVSPLSANLGPGETQTFTAAAYNPDGTPVTGAAFTWTLAKGALGTIDSLRGKYTAPATIAAAAYDTVNCTISGKSSWASVTVQLHP